MTKEDLRSKYMATRIKLQKDEVNQLSLSISNNFLTNFNISNNPLIHLFLPIEDKNEVNTFIIIKMLLKLKVRLCTSITNWKTNDMEVYELNENTKLKINKFGIPEPINEMQIAPEVINICLIPMLVFDNFGNRIGYGKGFYDKFLKEKCNSNILKVGLSFFEPHEEPIENDQWDIKMDYVVTPNKLYKFK